MQMRVSEQPEALHPKPASANNRIQRALVNNPTKEELVRPTR